MLNSEQKQGKYVPKIVLVGMGRFGEKHFRVLRELESEHLIEFSGVVIRSEKQRKKVENEYGIKTYKEITPSLLKNIDAVDVVTPPETHFEIIKKCLPYTNVFVEKPLATKTSDAKKIGQLANKYKHSVTVGHIFRYHPVTEELKKLLKNKNLPLKITGTFINPADLDQGREPSLEFLHLFDIVDMLWSKIPEVVCATADGRITTVDIRYEKYHDARFILGCDGNEKKRTLKFKYPDYTIDADFISNTITHKKGKDVKVFQCPVKQELLYKELYGFVQVLLGSENKVDTKTGIRVLSIAERAIPKSKKLPSVAIIGGGIFGTSVATELGKFCSVTIFEKNSDIMQEGAFVNCFRHHHGYHYPRSSETVVEIQNSRSDFEKIYKKAIVSSHKTYYSLAKKDSFVSVKEFLDFCKRHNLPYKKEYPSPNLLTKKESSLCVIVPETSYHYGRLKKITEDRLLSQPNIKIMFDTLVTNCTLTENGEKLVTYQKNKNISRTQKFDFVINATYANINNITNWLSFEKCLMRVDLAEELVIKLKTGPISMTVIDGPFATLMPTGNPNEFILYHVKESILDRYVPKNGLIKKDWKRKSNREAILKESLRFFPILKDAVVTESRVVHRGVQAYHEHDDVRVVDLIDHGFGCWSILSGKILSSVTTGKKVAKIIKESLKN